MTPGTRISNSMADLDTPSTQATFKSNIDTFHRIFKVFNAIAKNDAMAINFSLYIYFGNQTFVTYLDTHLDLLFKFRLCEHLYPDTRSLNFESIVCLLYSELEVIIRYLSSHRFTQICEYLINRIETEFDALSHKYVYVFM